MTGREKLLARMEANAESYCEAYPTAAALLNTAMQEALPWVMQMHTAKRTPDKLQLERLGTQILAILIASLPPEPAGNIPAGEARTESPAAEGSPQAAASWQAQRQAARFHSFK